MAGDRAANRPGGLSSVGASDDGGLDAELDRVVGSVEPIAYVIVFVGEQPGRVYGITRNTVVLGRADDADIHIIDASVSTRHARIVNTSRAFEIEDLSSTNGTSIGGQRIGRAPLRNGDRVTLGSVEFLFLVDRPVEATIALLPLAGRETLPVSAPGVPMPALPPPPRASGAEEEGPSLDDMIRRAAAVIRFIRRRLVVIVLVCAIGSILGLLSVVPMPPRSAAACTVKLLPKVKANPVDPNATSFRPDDEDAVAFFSGAEKAFGNPDLVRSTLKRVVGQDPTDREIDSVATRFKLERIGEHVYFASFTDPPFRAKRMPLVRTLATHVEIYVRTEIDRALREFNAKAQFLRDQLKDLDSELARVDDEKARFRE